MSTMKLNNLLSKNISKKALIRITIMLFIFAFLLVYLYWQSDVLPIQLSKKNEISSISREELINDYGFRVRLIGVTAAGGLVDVRFKILDKEKAAVLLKNPEFYPELVAEDGTILSVPAKGMDEMHLEDDGIVFMLYPNLGGVITPGSPVIIRFGNLELESILAQ